MRWLKCCKKKEGSRRGAGRACSRCTLCVNCFEITVTRPCHVDMPMSVKGLEKSLERRTDRAWYYMVLYCIVLYCIAQLKREYCMPPAMRTNHTSPCLLYAPSARAAQKSQSPHGGRLHSSTGTLHGRRKVDAHSLVEEQHLVL